MTKFSFKPPERFTSWSRSAQSDKYFVAFLTVWVLAIITTLLTILFTYQSLPVQIPLFYSRVWGEGQLAARAFIFLPMTGAFLLGLFNLAIGVNFHQQDKIISYLLAGTASLIAILSAITTINIIRLLV